ncbi:MAG: ABC transporter permease [Candidatus Thalassarchaeaceae archaeon]|jgi:ABC-2 type transport system permease protein|nr:ABC transporter permease [Candidatus Thalassarchaeaceae archaeon]
MNFTRIYAIAARKFATLRRDKRMFGFIVIMPALQILLFGWAIGGAPTGIDVIVIDDGPPAQSAVMIGHLEGSESLVINYATSVESAHESIEDGNAWAAIHLQSNGDIELTMDNSNQQISNVIMIEVRNAMQEASGGQLPMSISEPIYGERDPSFIDFLAPGIMTLVCFMFSTILTSMAFVGERHDGTLDRIFATGTKPMEVLFGHLTAFTLILVGQVTVVIAISAFGFDIPIVGSVLLLFAVCLLLGWAAMCLGLVVSSKAKSEFQAMQLNMPMLFPALLLSGILWPVQALPNWLQPVSWALPTTWTAEACRSIMIRGWGLESESVWMAFIANALFAVIMLAIACRTLKVKS